MSKIPEIDNKFKRNSKVQCFSPGGTAWKRRHIKVEIDVMPELKKSIFFPHENRFLVSLWKKNYLMFQIIEKMTD